MTNFPSVTCFDEFFPPWCVLQSCEPKRRTTRYEPLADDDNEFCADDDNDNNNVDENDAYEDEVDDDSTMKRALEIQENLEASFPSFIKTMVRSNIINNFIMVLQQFVFEDFT